MKELEQIRRDIREKGYLSALYIVLLIAKRKPGIKKQELIAILESIACKDIHKIEYTHSYSSTNKLKDLYYYNPISRKKKKRARKSKVV